MRKGVLGSIAALTAGAGLAAAQGPGMMPPGMTPPGMMAPGVMPASGNSVPIPPQFGGGGVDPGVIPLGEPAPNGAPTWPPPGPYGSTPYAPGGGGGGNPYAGNPTGPHFWFQGEELLWWAKNQPSRMPYITTGARAEGGVVGRPTTTVLVGDSDLGYGLINGGRLTGGWYKGDDRRHGVEISAFLLEQKGVFFYGQSDANGVPVIARPFTDATTGGQGVMTVAFPNLATGSVLFKTTTQTWGAEGSLVANLYRSCPDDCSRVIIEAVFGVRYMELAEDLEIASASTLLGQNSTSFAGLTVNAPATIQVTDRVATTNRFYGGQLGIKSEYRRGKWFVGAAFKQAAGVMNQQLEIDGVSGVNDPTRGIVAVNPGGLLANPSTITRLRKDETAYISEGQISLGYNWCGWLTSYVGYNCIYVSNVIRPADQITATVNPALVPASPTFGQGAVAPVPSVLFTQSEFWLQGVSFGMLVRY